MDRDKNWDRTKLAFDTITLAAGPRYQTAEESIRTSYEKGITDEFIHPAIIGNYTGIKAEDGIIIANFRPDRVKQLLQMLVEQNMFSHQIPILGMVEYCKKFPINTILEQLTIENTLGSIISEYNMKQLRIAETEKYAHVTYFFNGGTDIQYKNEERILVPSPKVKTYDIKPEMSAQEITTKLSTILDSNQFDLIVLNYANPDMVGHTGNMEATVKAVETIDHCLSQIIPITISKNIDTIVTADHGNVECMYDEKLGSPNTAHTIGKVPLILVSEKGYRLRDGKLSNIAPTILQLFNITQPAEMDEGLLYH